MRKNILIIISMIIISACSDDKKTEPETKERVILKENVEPVRVITATTQDFYHELASNGIIRAKQKADLRFSSNEIISDIKVKNGDLVKEGQILAKQDMRKLEQSLESNKISLANAKLSLQDVLIGQGYLLKDSLSIPQDVLELAMLKSGYSQALNTYNTAQFNLDAATLRAPFDGIIANIFSKSYNPPSGEAFCSVIDYKQMEIEFSVLENEFSQLKKGLKVQISPYAFSNIKGTGYISEINPVIEKNGLVKVCAAVPNNDGKLFDGMNVKVQIQKSIPNQIVLPKEAVLIRDGKEVVFRVKNGKALWTYVKTEFENSTSYTITQGVKDGDTVIIDGHFDLMNDAEVKIETTPQQNNLQ